MGNFVVRTKYFVQTSFCRRATLSDWTGTVVLRGKPVKAFVSYGAKVLSGYGEGKKLLVSPVSRKSPGINFGFKKVKLERNADNSGREFWA